jgi:galactokinase
VAYVVGTANVLSADVGRPLGADIVVGGDMIMGAGLSSSAALEVAVGGALNAVHGLDLSPKDLADAGYRAENEEVGMACGIMDQFASALGRSDHALRIDCRSREVEHMPFDTDRANLLVVDTNVAHRLTESGFNDRVRECHEATARLDSLLGKRVMALRDVTPQEVEAHADDLEPPLARRARHVTNEIRRVEVAAEALREGDIGRVGSLMRESHRSLRDDYEVSCAELNAVVEILDDRDGVYGCRMIGGGWGGSVLALADPVATADLTAAVEREYRDRTGIEADTYVFETGDGLWLVD